MEPTSQNRTCLKCDGSGTVQNIIYFHICQCVYSCVVLCMCSQMHSLGAYSQCTNCKGQGYTTLRCTECSGKGTLVSRKHINVTLPPAIRDGDSIQLTNCGHAKVSNKKKPQNDRFYDDKNAPKFENGNLYIKCKVNKHELFTIDDFNHIHIEITLPFSLATLGGHFTVPTIHGPNVIQILAGIQNNDYHCLKHKGIQPSLNNIRGNQYIHFKVQTPTKLCQKQKDLLNQLSQFENDPQTSKISNEDLYTFQNNYDFNNDEKYYGDTDKFNRISKKKQKMNRKINFKNKKSKKYRYQSDSDDFDEFSDDCDEYTHYNHQYQPYKTHPKQSNFEFDQQFQDYFRRVNNHKGIHS